MGIKDLVGSPSFTLTKEYKARDLTLHHFDFYRIDEAGLMANTLEDIVAVPNTIVAVEWADLVKSVLPTERLRIHIKAIDENSRRFKFYYPDNLTYLIPH